MCIYFPPLYYSLEFLDLHSCSDFSLKCFSFANFLLSESYFLPRLFLLPQLLYFKLSYPFCILDLFQIQLPILHPSSEINTRRNCSFLVSARIDVLWGHWGYSTLMFFETIEDVPHWCSLRPLSMFYIDVLWGYWGCSTFMFLRPLMMFHIDAVFLRPLMMIHINFFEAGHINVLWGYWGHKWCSTLMFLRPLSMFHIDILEVIEDVPH